MPSGNRISEITPSTIVRIRAHGFRWSSPQPATSCNAAIAPRKIGERIRRPSPRIAEFVDTPRERRAKHRPTENGHRRERAEEPEHDVQPSEDLDVRRHTRLRWEEGGSLPSFARPNYVAPPPYIQNPHRCVTITNTESARLVVAWQTIKSPSDRVRRIHQL